MLLRSRYSVQAHRKATKKIRRRTAKGSIANIRKTASDFPISNQLLTFGMKALVRSLTLSNVIDNTFIGMKGQERIRMG